MTLLRADHIGPLDMFKIGIGPSSSHTVGPMIAALEFRNKVLSAGLSGDDLRLQVELYGSLSATGKGHSTDAAVCAGLAGLHPKTAPVAAIWAVMPDLNQHPELQLGKLKVQFSPDKDIIWGSWTIDGSPLPHPNTIRFRLQSSSKPLSEQLWLSVGGGFVEPLDPATGQRQVAVKKDFPSKLPYPYNTAAEFVEQCASNNLAPWQIVVANEVALGLPEEKLRENLSEILQTMFRCIDDGLQTEGTLPGGLNVRRRAKSLHQQMLSGRAPAWAAGDL